MSAHRRQGQIDAPLETVWSLVGFPKRHPEWWPRVIEVDGERFEEGDEYVQVTRDPMGKNVETHFLLQRRDELREIRMSCQLTGTYGRWLLTSAQGGTFVELELGMEPNRLHHRLFDKTLGRRYFSAWSQESLKALQAVARREHQGART